MRKILLVNFISVILISILLFCGCKKEGNESDVSILDESKDKTIDNEIDNSSIENNNPDNKDKNNSNNSVNDTPTFSKGLAYKLSDDGTGYVVVGIGTCNDTDIVIPPEYNEKPIVAIGDNAFYPLVNNSLHLIKSVTLPKTITEIGGTAFAYNPLTEITLPEGLKTIKQGAFLGTMIESVSIPDSVKTIGTAAFMSLYLKSIYIGKGVTSIRLGTNAFLSAALEEISVSSENEELFVMNGALYVLDMRSTGQSFRLEAYPNASNAKSIVVLRNHTLSSGCLAFAYNLDEIHIQSENGTPCGPAFVAYYRIPLVDIAKLQNGSIKLSEINEQSCIHTNESITDIHLNMTKSAFLSEKRSSYVLPKSDGMRYEGYVYHFTDGIMSIEEYASLIN